MATSDLPRQNTCASKGTLTILIANIQAADLVTTIVLAAVGAVVSLLVTLLLKPLFEKKK